VPVDAGVVPLAAPLGPAGPSARPIRAIVGQVFTIAQARELVPKVVGCNITIHSGKSWHIRYLNRASLDELS
jgi:hypothetical protein